MTPSERLFAFTSPRPNVPPLDFNGPTVSFRPFREDWIERPAIELFRDVAEQYRDRIACEDQTHHLTFSEIWRASQRLAAQLDNAVASGKPVGVLLPNEASYPIAVLACLAAGRPCVMIDRHHPEERIATIIRDAGLAAVILRQSDLTDGLLLPAGIRTFVIDEVLQVAVIGDDFSAKSIPPGTPSFIVYTSGSTGQPKGVVLSQRAVLHRASELINSVHLRPDDKVLSLASPSTIGGLQQIFEVLLSGAALIKLDLQRVGLSTVIEAVAERRITMMFSTPAIWRSLARLEGVKDALASLRCIQSSGDTLLRVDYELIRAVLPADCHVLSVYGATEAPALLQWFVKSPPWEEVRVPVGYPLPNFDFSVLDEQGQPVEAGLPGEFVIRSRFTSLGLWQDGAVGPGPFEADVGSQETKIYRTGDLVRRRRDGLFVVLGRGDRQVKIRGNRVELAEIESALRRMPGIVDAAVVARRSKQEPILLGFVVPHAASTSLLDEVRRHLAATLPPYMRPREIFTLPSLPLLPGRKVDEEALLAHSAHGDAVESEPLVHAAWPSQHALGMVERAWRSVLGRPPRSRQASFEDAGGDSLQLLQFIFELERLADRPLPLERFHSRLTTDQFASAVEGCLTGHAEVLSADEAVVFLFPPGGGGDTYFTAFRAACAGRLVARQVAYPDLPAIARAGASFEDIAAHAVGHIAGNKPGGPLVLAGYSDGGDVAYEAARQLRASGRDVALLLILDTDATGLKYPAPPNAQRPFGKRLGRLVRRPRIRDLRRLMEVLLPAKILGKPLSQRMVRLALTLPTPLPANLAFVASLYVFQVLFDVHHRRWSAALTPAPLDVPVVLFHSEERRPGAAADLGWQPRTTELTIVPVPGNHSTMFAAERSEAIATKCVQFTLAVHARQAIYQGAVLGKPTGFGV